MDAHQKQAYRTAQELLSQGDTDAAVRVLADADIVDEAARVLSSEWRHADAARLILDRLGVDLTHLDILGAEQKKLIMLAAYYFAKAGDTEAAVSLYVAMGERTRAIDLLERNGQGNRAAELRRVPEGVDRLGPAPRTAVGVQPVVEAVSPAELDPDSSAAVSAAREMERAGDLEGAIEAFVRSRSWKDAGRLARRLDRLDDAAIYFTNAEAFFEAATCHMDRGDAESCLASLVRVPAEDSRYRTACLQAIRTASEFAVLNLELDAFLAEFIRSGPLDELEAELLLALGALFEEHDFPENAREVYRKVVAFDPTNVPAGQALKRVDKLLGPSANLQKILEEDEAFSASDLDLLRSSAPVDDLPDLPDLDDFDKSSAGVPAPTTPRPAPAAAPPRAPSVAPSGIMAFSPGTVIGERYELQQLIGQGGMAIVMKAHDRELDEDVALKIIMQVAMSEDLLDRFRRELRVSRMLSHPNIIRVHDIGVHHGHRYISMELLRGEALEARCGDPIDFAEGIGYLIQTCAGLQAAHDQGVIHRDIKPGNLFVTTNGDVKVMDFGLARQTNMPSGVTAVGMVAGTPNYISPEQINRPSEVTGAADLYSLGIVAYEMFTGELPFSHDELMPLLMMHATQDPRAPRSLNPGIPEALEQLILKLMAKNPQHRYATAADTAQALQTLRDSLSA